MCLKRSFECDHRPALKPLPPGLYTRLLALKVSRYLYYKISLFMSNFAKGNNSKNAKGNYRKNIITFFFKSSLGNLLIIL